MLILPTKLKLAWQENANQGSVLLELSDKPIYIGRGSNNDLVLSHSSVSRVHTRISNTPQGISVQDLDSRYGTFIDQRAIPAKSSVMIQNDVVLRLGNLKLDLQFVQSQQWSKTLAQEFANHNVSNCINHFKEDVISILDDAQEQKISSSQAQGAVELAYEETEQNITTWVEQNAVIHSIHLMLNQTPMFQDFLSSILPMVANVLKADRGFILEYDQEQKKLHSSANYHYEFEDSNHNISDSDLFSQTLARQCFDKNDLFIIEDTLNEINANQVASLSNLSVKSAVAIPLSYGERVLGVLYLDSQKNAAHFNKTQKSFLQALQIHIGTALKSAMHYSQAITDHLTGLHTRNYFEERIKESMEQAQRYTSTCSLILLDIDHFKNVNDSYGHNCGDEILKAVGEVLKRSARKNDVVGRLGGEEFIFLLAETNEEGALQYAERLRLDIAEILLQHGNLKISVTASFGIVEYHECFGVMPYRFIEEADSAMYEAKRTGRNKSCISRKEVNNDMRTYFSSQTLTG